MPTHLKRLVLESDLHLLSVGLTQFSSFRSVQREYTIFFIAEEQKQSVCLSVQTDKPETLHAEKRIKFQQHTLFSFNLGSLIQWLATLPMATGLKLGDL